MSELVTEVRLLVELNKEVFQNIAKKHNTSVEEVMESLNFREVVADALALKLERMFTERGSVSWELVSCIARAIVDTLEIEDEGLHEVMYFNGMITPQLPTTVVLKAKANIPVLKDEFRQLVIDSLVITVGNSCIMSEIVESHLREILPTIIE